MFSGFLAIFMVLTTSVFASAHIGQTREWTCVNSGAKLEIEIQRVSATGSNPPTISFIGVQQQGKTLGLTRITEEGVDPQGNAKFEAALSSSNKTILLVAPTGTNNTRPAQIKLPGKSPIDLVCHFPTFVICGRMSVTVSGGTKNYLMVTRPVHLNQPTLKVDMERPVQEALPGVLDTVKNGQSLCLESRDYSLELPATLRAVAILK